MKNSKFLLRGKALVLFLYLFFGYTFHSSNAQQQGALREFWSDVLGNDIDSLKTNEHYPFRPDFTDILPGLEAPKNFDSNYGMRLSALLSPTKSGLYRFWIQGDDRCELYLSSDSDPAGATLIASSPGPTETSEWNKFPEQQSDQIRLKAGRSYYIEVLHKESNGTDHMTVEWELDRGFGRSPIPSTVLSTTRDAPTFDPEQTFFLSSGKNRRTFLPTKTTQLSASLYDQSKTVRTPIIAWEQLSGADVEITSANTLNPYIEILSPGEYIFEVTATIETESHSDQVTINVYPELSNDTGEFIQEIWLETAGETIDALLNHINFPNNPHLVRSTNSLFGPRNWGSWYAMRTRGFITAPETGDYTFYVMGDNSAALFLSDNENEEDIQLIAFTPQNTTENNWTEFPEQKSDSIHLVKGLKYYLELHFSEGSGHDYHGVAWSLNNEKIAPIDSSFFIPKQPEALYTPDFDDVTTFVVDAGFNQFLNTPDNSIKLKGRILKINDAIEIESIEWTQVSGPANAEIVTPDAFETIIGLPKEGVYVFQMQSTANGDSSSDKVTVSRLKALNENTGGITREVWLNVPGESVETLLAAPNYPNQPDITDQLSSLTSPINWGSNYGSRGLGYLVPTRTGLHTFYLSSNDEAILKLSENQNNQSAVIIATSPRGSIGSYSVGSQISEKIHLVAGERYYIEILHKQNYGNDHFQVEWSYGDENSIQPIGGGNLEPFYNGIESVNTSLTEYAYAGPDRHYYYPTKTIDLPGEILEVGESDSFHSTRWTYTGNVEGVEIHNDSALNTKVTLPDQGQYTFRLSLNTNAHTHFDDVTITILPRLSNQTVGLNRSVWLRKDGTEILDLLEDDPLLENPTFEDIIQNLETPSNWTDNYGTRLSGFIHAPATGDYKFWIAADETAQLWISTSKKPQNSRIVAEISQAVKPREWDIYAEQASDAITLKKNKKYYIEVLQKELNKDDHLSVSWTGPGLNHREVITAGYLSPAYNAPKTVSELLVIAGDDQSILWPDKTVSLAPDVYDHEDGPEPLTYQWTATDPNVVFSFPNKIRSDAVFPGHGAYELTLTVTDGEHTTSDSLTVSVQPGLANDAGSITREVWLDIQGYEVDNLTNDQDFPDHPDIVDTLASFDAPQDWADNYGQRIRGYILPPANGFYEFVVAGDNHVQVSINTRSNSFETLTPIISLNEPTNYQQWDKSEGQSSEPIKLIAGNRYPIEILHKEGTGYDHLSLAWILPNSDVIQVIENKFIAPVQNAPAASKNLIAVAPKDVHQRWPQNKIELHGQAFDLAIGPDMLTTRWEQLSGPGTATFNDTGSLSTSAHLSEPGEYTLRLVASDGGDEVSDTMIVRIDQSLSTQTGAATRSLFTDIPGENVTDMTRIVKYPSSPDKISALSDLQAPANIDEQYGTLVTAFLYPPKTGLYQFSVTGDDWAEVWLSKDEDPEDKALICLSPKPTEQFEWDKYPEYQTSAKIKLRKGRRYYIEIRHKEQSGSDHFSVAWLRPGEEDMSIIQGAYLSPISELEFVPPEILIEGKEITTLHVGDTYIEPGFTAVDSNGVDITDQVIVKNHVNTDHAGSYSIHYEVINQDTGFAETVVRTVNVTIASSETAIYELPAFTPPSGVDWTEPQPSSISKNEASRFLAQATFGPTMKDISHLQAIGYSAWIDEQIDLPGTLHLPSMKAIEPILEEFEYNLNYSDERLATWWKAAIEAPDQLRQRVAFALSEILVLSDKELFRTQVHEVTNYYDILVRNSLGSYRQLLEEVTLNPMMGQYLTMLRSSENSPDENYPRELMQLFTIGLNLLNPDGTPILDESGFPIPTYDQRVVLELSRAFTGWTFAGSQRFDYVSFGSADYFAPMIPFDQYHDFGKKELMGGFILPQGLTPREDLNRALDHISEHPNIGPFISYRLIQRLVTSNPSPPYVYRVARAFEDDGTGNRGNLAAVIKAILLDPEAREPEKYAIQHHGKLREPIVRLAHLLRAFNATSSSNPPILNRYPISNTTKYFGQAPLQAVSVFNFFLPSYAPPGEISEAGLVAPEFGITTELTTVDTADFLYNSIDNATPLWGRYSAIIKPNVEELITNAKDTDFILDQIDLLLMAGSMSSEMRGIMKSTIDAIDDAEMRVKSALMLILSSPEFSIQK